MKEQILEVLKDIMNNSACGIPYKGAKEHYILDIDNADFCKNVVSQIEKVTQVPKSKKKC